MSRLTQKQIEELVTSPKNGSNLARAVENQYDNQLHTIPIVSRGSFTPAHNKYLKWVKDRIMLSEEKFDSFKAMFNPPFQTTELLQSIYSVISLIFESKDKNVSVDFTNNNLKEDFLKYRKETLQDFSFFKNEGLKGLKDMPSCYLLVDLPQDQEGSRPEPYFMLLDPRNIIDVDDTITTKHQLKTEYIIFTNDDYTKTYVYDDEYYRVYESEKGDKNDLGKLILETPHDLGYCPAKSLWNVVIEKENLQLKQAPQTPSLSSLDLLLFFMIGKEIANFVDFFPIWYGYPREEDYKSSIYQQSQTYTDSQNSGSTFFREDSENWADNIYKIGVNNDKRNKDLRGAGSFVKKPIPTEDNPDLGIPYNRVPSDVPLMEQTKKDLVERKEQIHANCVGKGSVNEFTIKEGGERTATEVSLTEERRRKTLDQYKESFEIIYKWALQTVVYLRYNKSQVTNIIVSLGNDYLTFTTPELERQYKEAKDNGAPETLLMEIQQKIIFSKYQNNPDIQQELIIKLHLEPFQTLGIEEVNTIKDKKGRISDIDYQIKLNFISFIQRFQSENGLLIEFGKELEFDQRIKIIKEALTEYANEKLIEINGENEDIEENEIEEEEIEVDEEII